jgi:folate-dependent phosphoribosylglycinamide formyltransferase PurN
MADERTTYYSGITIHLVTAGTKVDDGFIVTDTVMVRREREAWCTQALLDTLKHFLDVEKTDVVDHAAT